MSLKQQTCANGQPNSSVRTTNDLLWYSTAEDPILTQRLSQLPLDARTKKVEELVPQVTNQDMFRLVVKGESVLEREKRYAENLIKRVNRHRGALGIFKHTCEIEDLKVKDNFEDGI